MKKIPYIREILLVSLGLNISFFFLSLATNNSTSMLLALASGAMCGWGLWFTGQENTDDS